MWKTLTKALAALVLSATVVSAQQQPITTPYGEQMVAQMETVLNYESTWGLTTRRDLETVSGSASVTFDTGFLSLQTGTTAGSVATLESVDFGKYHPGRRSVIGLGVIPKTFPTGDGVFRFGGFTASNGVFGELKDSNSDGQIDLCIVYRSPLQTPNDQEKCITNDNQRISGGNPKPDDFDFTQDAFIFNIYFNWYGIGGAFYEVLYVGNNGALKDWAVGRVAPSSGQAMEDPNVPIAIEADNGTASENIEIQVGGRRFDIEGEIGGFARLIGDFREDDVTVATGNSIPLICARRKSEFPAGSGRRNTVPAAAEAFSVATDQDLKAYIVIDPSVSGGTWDTAREHNNDETALEFNVGVTTIGTANAAVTGPFPIFTSGNNNNQLSGAGAGGVNVQLPGEQPACLMVRNDSGNTATITLATFNFLEDW